jgi:site-specific recombinase XerC
MTKPNHCPFNERIKRRYFLRLKETRGYSVATVDGVAAAISRFESFTGYKDFKKFHLEQVRAFKRHLLEQAKAVRSGQGLSAATISSTLRSLKVFVEWLGDQPGYRSKITYCDADYFTPPAQQERIAAGRMERPGTAFPDSHPDGRQPKHTVRPA